jgi:hypothetical protein
LVLLFVLWIFTDTYIVSYDRENLAVARMVAYGLPDLHAYTLAQKAAPLVPGGASVFSSGPGKYDYYAALSNPNAQWYADFTYQFASSAGESPVRRGFILPGEEKPVVEFAVAANGAPRAVEFKLLAVNWHHADRHTVGDYEQWRDARLAFEISEVMSGDVEVDGKKFGRVSFIVTNRGAYSFYDPAFYILLKRGASVVGVNSTTLSELRAGETAQVNVNWFDLMPAVNKVEVVPVINIFDPAAYKPLE